MKYLLSDMDAACNSRNCILFVAYNMDNPANECGKYLYKDGTLKHFELSGLCEFNSRRYLISVLKKQSPKANKVGYYGRTSIEIWEDDR